jgi:trk system potassium uptake protein TrkA
VDVQEPETFRELGMSNLNGAIVSMASSLEASIITTMMCQEMGIPRIIAKARNQMHEKILRSVGAQDVIYPEVEMGRRLARHLVADNFSDWINLSEQYSMVEMDLPEDWAGRSLVELQLREKHNINVVGIRVGEDVMVNLDPKAPLPAASILIVIGANKDLEALER